MSNQTVEVTVDEDTISFTMNMAIYNAFINAMANTKKQTQVCHNFCVQNVVKEDEAKLAKLLKLPGVSLSLAGEVIEEYSADVEIAVKKPKPTTKD